MSESKLEIARTVIAGDSRIKLESGEWDYQAQRNREWPIEFEPPIVLEPPFQVSRVEYVCPMHSQTPHTVQLDQNETIVIVPPLRHPIVTMNWNAYRGRNGGRRSVWVGQCPQCSTIYCTVGPITGYLVRSWANRIT